MATPKNGKTPWRRFQEARRRRGVAMGDIERFMGMGRSGIRQMLLGHYGHPATPEKKARLLAALNEGPGEPVTESDIWPEQPEPGQSA